MSSGIYENLLLNLNLTLTSFRHSYIFNIFFRQVYWLGDLNYRITDLTTTQVKTLLSRQEIVTLLKADQLNQQKERGNVLLVCEN